MNRSVGPAFKRLVSTQTLRRPAAATSTIRANSQLVASQGNNNNNNNNNNNSDRTLKSPKTQLRRNGDHSPTSASATNDHYNASSFETALDQVLRLELDCPSRTPNCHQHSMETSLRDFFKV